jgi:hypothetical protein
MNRPFFNIPVVGIVVTSPEGYDGDEGSWFAPVKTLTKALSLVSASRATIIMLPGEYAEETMIDWPDISGISIIGMGGVSISNAGTGAAVIDIHPTYTASSMSISMKDITIAADTQIGLQIDNAHMTKKLNIYLDGVSIEDNTSGGGSSDSFVSMPTTVHLNCWCISRLRTLVVVIVSVTVTSLAILRLQVLSRRSARLSGVSWLLRFPLRLKRTLAT